MATLDRPAPPAPRAWILVACLAPLSIVPGLILDADGLLLLTAVTLAGLIGVSAALVWAVQRSHRHRRHYEARLTEWAAERAVAQERLRIARDLHDLTSHGLGVITIRASTTSFLEGSGADGERDQALRDIERVSRETMTELRRMLTLLRTPGDVSAPLRPADTLATLPAIVADAERHGLTVRLDSGSEDGAGLNPGVQLTACAVIREALANVLRHAGPTTATVVVAQAERCLTVEISDDGPQPGWRSEPGAGQGLTGLRERLATHGGSLDASPDGTGFVLHARIPLSAE